MHLDIAESGWHVFKVLNFQTKKSCKYLYCIVFVFKKMECVYLREIVAAIIMLLAHSKLMPTACSRSCRASYRN